MVIKSFYLRVRYRRRWSVASVLGQRVLDVVPGNEVLLPGKASFEMREVLGLRFMENFFAAQPDKADAHGRHFWSGEGASNQYFEAVTHWMPVPEAPAATEAAD